MYLLSIIILKYSKKRINTMRLTEIKIKEATESDYDDTMEIEKKAFGYDKEAKLVSDLLEDKSAEPRLSLLAFHNNKAIGHILFTKAIIEREETNPLAHILAPLAILPEYQNKGVGGLLIKEGLEILKEMGSEIVFVLGHEEYYPKYGFIPDAESLGCSAPYPIPPEHAGAWMVQALTPKGLYNVNGKVRCSDMLNKEEHWRE